MTPKRRALSNPTKRGAALLLALLAVAVAVTLALTFLGAQSTAIGIARNIQDHAKARYVAESGLELAVAHVRANDTWRTDRPNGTWVADEACGPGTFTIAGHDGVDADGDGLISVPAEGDGDLTDDPAELVTLSVTGKVNGTTHVVRAVLTPCPAGGALLFVVGDPTSLTGGETVQKDLFESWGWTVTLHDDDALQADYDTAMSENDVALVSESVSSASVGTKLLATSEGVVLEKVDLGDEFGLTQNYDTASSRKNVQILNEPHYITEPLALGNHDVFSSNQTMHRQADSIAPGASVLCNHTFGGKPSLYVVDTGDDLYGGGTAAGRRAQLPWGQSVDYTAMTADGRTLTKRTVEWASQGSAGDVNFGYETEFSSSQGAVNGKQIATQVTLGTEGTLVSISANVKGVSTKLLRYAIYSDSGGEPETLLAETDSEAIGSDSFHWHTITTPSVALTPGTYWLALSFEHSNMEYRYNTSGGQTRQNDNDAISSGFSATWGGSSGSDATQISIYAAISTSGGGGGGGGYTYAVNWQEG